MIETSLARQLTKKKFILAYDSWALSIHDGVWPWRQAGKVTAAGSRAHTLTTNKKQRRKTWDGVILPTFKGCPWWHTSSPKAAPDDVTSSNKATPPRLPKIIPPSVDQYSSTRAYGCSHSYHIDLLWVSYGGFEMNKRKYMQRTTQYMNRETMSRGRTWILPEPKYYLQLTLKRKIYGNSASWWVSSSSERQVHCLS